MRQWMLSSVLCVCVFNVYADNFPVNTYYHVCFTPQGRCMTRIVGAIYQAKHTINIQAYSFTSWRMERALLAAAKRGVQVEIIMDQTQFSCPNYAHISQLLPAGIAIFKDKLEGKHNSKRIIGIAHNKVIIVDGSVVLTGSYNFTYAAQHYNAENSLMIRSKPLAKHYYSNWLQRKKHSTKITSFSCRRY